MILPVRNTHGKCLSEDYRLISTKVSKISLRYVPQGVFLLWLGSLIPSPAILLACFSGLNGFAFNPQFLLNTVFYLLFDLAVNEHEGGVLTAQYNRLLWCLPNNSHYVSLCDLNIPRLRTKLWRQSLELQYC